MWPNFVLLCDIIYIELFTRNILKFEFWIIQLSCRDYSLLQMYCIEEYLHVCVCVCVCVCVRAIC